MEIITSRKTVESKLLQMKEKGFSAWPVFLEKEILSKKIKFPLLEFAAAEIFEISDKKKQIALMDKIISYHSIGGNVIAGKILQLRLDKHFRESFEKAVKYIVEGNEWYVCDIIGERVMGFALLNYPEKTIPVLKKFARHKNDWIIRTVGVATHYAVKKGLEKKYVEEMFLLLLSLGNAAGFHIKTGTGWGAKTCVKFYPDIAEKYKDEINSQQIRQWFRTKVNIGLGRSNKYAAKYKS